MTDAGRFVIVSGLLGVWLGDYRWSKRNPGGATRAPTYAGAEVSTITDLLNMTGTGLQLSAKLVTPSEGMAATEQDCLGVGLEGWTVPAQPNPSEP